MILHKPNYIKLREITELDAERTFKWRQSSRALFLGGSPESLIKQKEWISSRPVNEFNFVIEKIVDQQSVGMISLVQIDSVNLNAQSARFLIGEEAECKGLPVAAEAMLLLYEFAFYELNLHRVYGFISAENFQMIKWQKFMGMRHEGTWKEHLLNSSQAFVDAELFGLSKLEFETNARVKLLSFIRMQDTEKKDGR